MNKNRNPCCHRADIVVGTQSRIKTQIQEGVRERKMSASGEIIMHTKGKGTWGGRISILSSTIKSGLIEKMTLEQRPEGSEGVSSDSF